MQPQPWCEVHVRVPSALAEDAGALVVNAGALGVQVIDDLANPDNSTLVLLYDMSEDDESVIATTLSGLGEIGLELSAADLRISRHREQDWAENWKAYFKPLKIGQHLWIVPTWEKEFAVPKGDTALLLDPGMAFGTGQHATTALCLAAIERFLTPLSSEQRAALTLLDLGCGTGILAIGAAKLGVQKILATDNDPDAVDATDENARVNHVEHLVRASGEDIADLPTRYDVLVANILAVTLIDLCDLVLDHVAPQGHLILSGILATQAEDVIACYNAALQRRKMEQIKLLGVQQESEWVVIEFGL